MNSERPASPADSSTQTAAEPVTVDKGISAQRLKSFIQRIERLEEERRTLGADVREVYSEAKSSGFDTKIMRRVIVLRKMDPADRQEMEALLQVYVDAVGM